MKRSEFVKLISSYSAGILSWTSFLAGAGSDKISAGKVFDLSGTWNFQLDPDDAGIKQSWFKKQLRHALELPGSIQEQGFGEDITADTQWVVGNNYYDKLWFTSPIFSEYRKPGNLHFIEWLQPEKHYVGAAWFQREVDIPREMADKRLILHLERCHWQTSLWVNGEHVGSRNSLATQHEYNVSGMLSPRKNRLSLRVDNSMIVDVGVNAHTVTDHTQSAWNGMVGRNELQVTPKTWIEDVQVFPDLENNSAMLEIRIGNTSDKPQSGRLKVQAKSFNSFVEHQISPIRRKITLPSADEKIIKLTLPLGEKTQRWDEFNPALYKLQADLELSGSEDSESGDTESYETIFGMREVCVEGRDILVNGRPVLLRGNLECCIFPKTGYPPTDTDAWLRIFQKHKRYGFNHVRFHSWCPPRAAFEAADQTGIYIQAEVGVWNGIKSDKQRTFLLEESRRILESYGNHPSFIMLGLGNEAWCKKDIMRQLLSEWKQDKRRIYTGLANSNGSIIDQYDYFVGREMESQRIRFQSGWPPQPDGNCLISKPPNTNTDFQENVKRYPNPLISHEIGQRCTYPDLDQGKKYTGSFSAGYLVTARDQLNARGMGDQWKDFIEASGRWQIALYKEEIEACLRTADLAGFHLLQLHDFPGQSGALVGVLDAFWDEKGYCGPEEFSAFCSPTVPLARMEKRVWIDEETFSARMQLLHYGEADLGKASCMFGIEDSEGKQITREKCEIKDKATGRLHDIDEMSRDLSSLPAPGRYRLTADVEGVSFAASNSWDFWVFPSGSQSPKNGEVSVEKEWSTQLQERLKEGETILLEPRNQALKGDLPPCFLSMYWTQFGLDGGESQSMGLLCDPSHPVFTEFPTESHTNWHWWELLSDTSPMIFDGYEHEAPWPKAFRPIVQLIDGWETNRKLGVLAEARMGKGKIMISSVRLSSISLNSMKSSSMNSNSADLGSENDGSMNQSSQDLRESPVGGPVARQFRKSVLAYMNSDAFDPETEVEAEHMDALFKS